MKLPSEWAEEHADERVEFEKHGLEMVQLEHRNVCKQGFGDAQGVEAGGLMI